MGLDVGVIFAAELEVLKTGIFNLVVLIWPYVLSIIGLRIAINFGINFFKSGVGDEGHIAAGNYYDTQEYRDNKARYGDDY